MLFSFLRRPFSVYVTKEWKTVKTRAVSGWLPQFNGNFLVQSYTFAVKFSWIRISLSRDMEQNCGKCPISQCWRILQKFLDPHLEADDFQNLHIISSSLSTDTSVVKKFSWRYVHEFLRKVAKRQTDKRRALHNLLGGGKNISIILTTITAKVAVTMLHYRVAPYLTEKLQYKEHWSSATAEIARVGGHYAV